MLQTVIKLFISSGVIVLVSEIAKKNTYLGGLIASIPLVSVLSMIWLYIDTKDIESVRNLSNSILWMVIPSISLFISLPILLRSSADSAEKEIIDLKNNSGEKISKIAIETSSELIKELIGLELNKSSISAIVEDQSRKKKVNNNVI